MDHNFARELRKNMTDAERRLWSALRRRELGGWKFRRQAPVGPYIIVDFVCFEKKVVIELDGGQHAEQQKAYDAVRTRWLTTEGFSIVRFWNHQVFEELDDVLEAIWHTLGGASNPSPRCTSSSLRNENRNRHDDRECQ